MSYYVAVFEGGPCHGKIMMIEGMPKYWRFSRMPHIPFPNSWDDKDCKFPDPINIDYRLSHVNYRNKKAFQNDTPMELVYRFGEVGLN